MNFITHVLFCIGVVIVTFVIGGMALYGPRIFVALMRELWKVIREWVK
jgi:hypothetical protein